jgi:4'-phosphopantetheinyl transferase EntD
MITEILPPAAIAVEAFGDPPEAMLFPEEEAVIARAVEKRRREFATARTCARAALATLGLPLAPILTDERRAPIWPDGVVGSITHCDGYRAAVVARECDVMTIGIDAEVHEALPPGVLDLVALPAEHDRLHRLAADTPELCWDRLLFSVKESVYKAWYPLTHHWLDFTEADVTLDPTGEFFARLLVSGPVSGFAGRWLVRDGLLLAAIAGPRSCG